MRFLHKHVVITGGARGIGFGIAQQFAKEGAMISLLDNNKTNLAQAKKNLESLKVPCNTYVLDVKVRKEVYKVIDECENVQPIDILINNAGIAAETPFLNIEENEWDEIISTNLTGLFYVAQATCRHMAKRKNGVVINMGSKNSIDGEFGYAHYNASKGGILMLTKTMAIELAHLNIRVNTVCPGYIQTPMSMEIDSREFTRNFVNQFIPLNRAGSIEDVSPVFLFLASNDSSFITGQTFIIDGGQLAGQKANEELLSKIKI